MNTPSDLRYTKEHEWVKIESDDVVVFGITDFAQSALGDVVFASLPKVGASLTAGQTCGEVESTKSVSEIYAPVDGKILQVNEAVNSQPELINSDPFSQGWLFEVTAPGSEIFEKLLTSEAYGEITSH